jgi:hypothetical protein
MSELVRSRQGDYELSPDRVLEYQDLDAGLYTNAISFYRHYSLLGCFSFSFGGSLLLPLCQERQGDYELSPDRVLEYQDLDAGEEVWGPKVEKFLTQQLCPDHAPVSGHRSPT